MNPSTFTGGISVTVYEIHQEMRGKCHRRIVYLEKKDIQESELQKSGE